MPRHPRPPEDRFNEKFDRSDGCWEWKGRKVKKYGQLRMPGKGYISAHRFSYALFCGPIPDNTNVLHTCDNPGCVRPDHLFLGTAADNVRDMIRKGRAQIGTHRRKISPESAYTILWRGASGEKHRDLAIEYGISRQAAGDIINRHRWPSLSQIHD